jgi:hypothetical protein
MKNVFKKLHKLFSVSCKDTYLTYVGELESNKFYVCFSNRKELLLLNKYKMKPYNGPLKMVPIGTYHINTRFMGAGRYDKQFILNDSICNEKDYTWKQFTRLYTVTSKVDAKYFAEQIRNVLNSSSTTEHIKLVLYEAAPKTPIHNENGLKDNTAIMDMLVGRLIRLHDTSAYNAHVESIGRNPTALMNDAIVTNKH